MGSGCRKIERCALRDVLKCDEFGLFFQTALDRKIATSSFAWRKTKKVRSKSFTCFSADRKKVSTIFHREFSKKALIWEENWGKVGFCTIEATKKVWIRSSIFIE